MKKVKPIFKKIFSVLKKEFSPLVLFIASHFVFDPLCLLGIIYNFGKSIYECFQVKFWNGPLRFFIYWICVLYQIWNVLKYLQLHLAIAKDLLANVMAGEMLEDIITDREETLFGKGNITMSAATGHLESIPNLNPRGWLLTGWLSKVLGENHSINAYKSELNKIY